ncbi:MAG: glycosyltransferase family 1 protein [Phycisphaerales bacterium]|nr:glycosyltransferase family 1 protein [Phycisphaerales bacterium]
MPTSTRLCLFTDTLGDINGVSRFIRNIAEQALAAGRELHALTSTRFECPEQANIHNLAPRWAGAMPGYPQLELAIPDRRALFARADRLRPTCVHVSTPGPIGTAGRRYAVARGLPLLGTYHTDFPAYIDHLFDDRVCTWTCSRVMRWFYRPFARVFTRSDEYALAMQGVGISPERIVRLLPGIDTAVFHSSFHDPGGDVWRGCPGVRPSSVKVLYVGRVSVEKNLPALARVWKIASAACRSRGIDAQLLIVGDGPYRVEMQRALAPTGTDACFLGFRHGRELSTIYATSDLFVFPSTTDTLGQVVMEAQSAGLPVIVADVGGPRTVVDDRRTGFILPADDEPRWADTIVSLAADPARRRTLGAAAHAKIQPLSIRASFEAFYREHEQAVA